MKIIHFILLIFLWGYLVYYCPKLPEIVPTHFDFKGEVDSWGDKKTILFLPILGTLMYFLFNFLSKNKSYLNIPIKITDSNRNAEYAIIDQCFKWIQLSILVIFNTIQYCVIADVSKNEGSSHFLIFVELFILFVLVFYFISRMYLFQK